MNLLEQYKASLKAIEIEELPDLLFFRPIAFIFVKIFYPTRLTPNHISLISLAVGVISGIVLAFGSKLSLALGGVLYLLATALDCSDGMLARLKKNGTKVGRVVDGAVDYLTTLAVYIGMAIGLTKLVAANQISLPMNPWLLAIVMNLAHALHAIFTDYYRNMYESQVFGKSLDPKSQIMEFEQEKLKLGQEKGKKVEKFIVSNYIRYCKIQLRKNSKPSVRYAPEGYAKYNRVLVFLWNLIGPAIHAFLLGLSLFLVKPMVFFWFVIVFANLWMLLLFVAQKYFDRKLEAINPV
jgi:phosphatidylglycerophosphate synthase